MKITKEDLLAELARRRAERDQIIAAVRILCIVVAKPEHIYLKKGQGLDCIPFRAKRGALHAAVAAHLRVPLNNGLGKKIAAALYEIGVIPVQFHGDNFYRGIELRTPPPTRS